MSVYSTWPGLGQSEAGYSQFSIVDGHCPVAAVIGVVSITQ